MIGNILFDSNIIIDFARLRDKSDELLGMEFKGLVPHISAITFTELWSGKSMDNPKEFNYIETYLKGIRVIVPDEKIAKKAGLIVRESKMRIQFSDAIIAATAIENDLTLFTFNYKDFADIKGLKILTNKYSRS